MTHNEKRTVWWKEGLIGAVIGIQFGILNVMIGHPFDTLKTKMQVQESYKNKTFLQSVKSVYITDGVKGFYRGGLSIVLGSSMFRSTQFSAFEAFHSRFDKQNLKGKSFENFFTKTIPCTMGLEVRTLFAGVFSGICRSILECPFEYIKIRKQVATQFKFKNTYQGLFPLMLKNSLMISIGFCFIDSFRRNTNAWKSSLGIFLASGTSTICCHLLIWPIEIFRNNYMANNKNERKNINELMKENVKQYGVMRGVFRGALPGLISTFLRNGLAMVLLQKIQRLFTTLGFRD